MPSPNSQKIRRLCCLKHMGIEFEYQWEDTTTEISEATKLISRCNSKETDCKDLNCLYANGQKDPFYDTQRPAHSDFLVHWTGKDIDDKHDPLWEQNNDPELNLGIIKPYLERLKNILKYGFWMTSSKNDKALYYQKQVVHRPPFYRTCFSELKLSEARVHAKRFGRLGIGVKRPFLLGKRGSPMIYYQEKQTSMFFEPYKNETGKIVFPECAWWPYYLKSMNEGPTNKGYINYKNFDESEWRVIYSEEIKQKFGNEESIRDFPKDDNRFAEYLRDAGTREEFWPKYLLPLDRWLAIIIYPSLAVKVEAESDPEFLQLVEDLKPNLPSCSSITRSSEFEKFSKPFGIDLDACRNF